MTVQEGIAILRSIVNQTSDDNTYTDEFLYELLAKARAEILDKEYNKFDFKSPFDRENICVPLCVATSHDCDCVPVGCKVLKSKFKVPRSLTMRGRDTMEVYTLGEEKLLPSNKEQMDSFKWSEFRKNAIGWEIRNDFLILWNADIVNGYPRVVRVSMIAEDPVVLASVPKCDSNGNYTGETCADPYIVDLKMKSAYEMLAYQRVLDFLQVKAKFPVDETNNSNETR
jgi:hypothetical protein